MIPYVKFKARNRKVQASLSALNERLPYGYRETIRALQIRLEREMAKNGEKILMVTSTMPDEGKSTRWRWRWRRCLPPGGRRFF